MPEFDRNPRQPTRERLRRGLATGLLVFLATVAIASAVTAILPRHYSAVARVGIELQPPPVGQAAESFDPYFIQTEFEVIRSDPVLGQVVADLKLRERWAPRGRGADPLSPTQAADLLRSRLTQSVVRGTSLVAIHCYSEQATEAAEIANAVATAYAALRQGQVRAYDHARRQADDPKTVDRPARLVEVEVVDRAEPPLRPIRPNALLNLTLGIGAGLVLGLLAVMLRVRRLRAGAPDDAVVASRT